ncbi:Sulfotransfer 1 domain containing protein [Trichuris trichiura]|uniref:Sulfotransfer 1 domain containing protein n=1 Tax=Trichuris trichiura TaxID=36087 RepID=A0A077Z5F8_TRITR|nr:Sulfotransfer 1 domain containing protein [Trichuris trichiura]
MSKSELLDENGNLQVGSLEQMYRFRLPRSFKYAGYVWPGVTVSVDRMEYLNNFEFRPSDIIILSYPKSGTTWVSEIVSQLCHSEEAKARPLHERVPWLEMESSYIWVRFYWFWHMLTKLLHLRSSEGDEKAAIEPRMWFSHLPLELMPKPVIEGKCKVVYVCRNPKDTAVSYYHFHRMARFLGQQDIAWDDFFPLYTSGNIYCGSWFEHVTSYWKLSKLNPNMIFVKYEDMQVDLRSQIQRLIKFLDVHPTSEMIDNVIHTVQFNTMKSSRKSNRDGVWLFNQNVSEFIRKGEVGDWKNYFTVAQSETFDKIYEYRMKSTGIDFDFEMN